MDKIVSDGRCWLNDIMATLDVEQERLAARQRATEAAARAMRVFKEVRVLLPGRGGKSIFR